MSALGQKQTFAVQKVMSALPPTADICTAPADVCFVPIADITLSAMFQFEFALIAGSLLRVYVEHLPHRFRQWRSPRRSVAAGCWAGRRQGILFHARFVGDDKRPVLHRSFGNDDFGGGFVKPLVSRFWFTSGHSAMSEVSPLYSRKRISVVRAEQFIDILLGGHVSAGWTTVQ